MIFSSDMCGGKNTAQPANVRAQRERSSGLLSPSVEQAVFRQTQAGRNAPSGLLLHHEIVGCAIGVGSDMPMNPRTSPVKAST